MKNTVRTYLKALRKDRSRHRKLAAVLVCLSVVVAGSTVWALHTTGESQTAVAYCGYEEHQHTEECIEKVLICGLEEGAAESTEATASPDTDTQSGHVHTDECYATQSVLTCTEAEHTHSDSCYDEDGNLVCALPEHTHDESCYTTEQVLVCGLEEGAAESTEATASPDTDTQSGHVHTDECYEITYTCGLEEHQHTLSCFSNPEADVETAADWEKTFADVELTGDFATDLVAIARTQLGYAESTDNYKVVLDDAGNETEQTKGYTRYGAWYGMPYEDWCAMFVSFCLNYADITSDMLPYSASCPDWVESLSQLGFYEPVYVEELDEDGNTITVRNNYTPETGDLIFFDWDGNGSANHVGIVEELETKETTNDDGTISYEYIVHTIEGNSSSKVAQREYDLYDEEILGYGSIYSAYLSAVDNGLIDGVRHLTAETEDGVTFSAIGEIPENAVLEVSPLTEEQIAYIGENFDSVALGENGNYAYDIKILLDGEEYTPESPIRISVSGLGIDYHYSVTGYHLADVDADTLTDVDAAEVNVEQTDVNSTGNRISYDADGFSISVFTVGATATFSDVEAVDSLTIKLITKTYNKDTKDYDQEEDANGTDGETLPLNGEYPCYEYTESNTHYYLIPVAYLSEKYKDSGFVFSETQTCPFVYLTYSGTLDWTKAPAGSYVEISGEYYLKVKCASGSPPVICYTVLTVATDTVTPSNTVINMFDYWTTVNRLDSDNHGSTWYNAADMTRGINEKHVLKFGKSMGSSYGDLNYSWGGDENTPSKVTAGIVENTLTDGYPILTSNSSLGTNGESLAYLFDPTEEVDGKQSFTRVTGLLSVDSQGYFYYNSAERYAQLNEETKAFTVYEQPAGKNDSLKTLDDTVKYGQFYPYNDAHQVALLDREQNPINHYFGMTLTTRFIQSYEGYTTALHSTPTTFSFSGDNDVWIFIDNVLVADLGGLSSARSVTIDFSTGEVNINDGTTDGSNPSTTLKEAFEAANKAADWQTNTIDGKNYTTFATNTTHTLKFYYLERGNYDSNLMLKYNLIDIPATAIYKVDQYGDPLEDATFAVYASNADGEYLSDIDGREVDLTSEANDGWCVNLDTSSEYYGSIMSAAGTVLVKALYTGTTDNAGSMPFVDGDNMYYSLAELKKMFGTYFLLQEIDVPDGYRTVSDTVLLTIQNDLLQLAGSAYETGVWTSPNAMVTATNNLYVVNTDDYSKVGADTNGAINYYTLSNDGTTWETKGSLFAVVLARGTGDADAYDQWTPVTGNDLDGYDYQYTAAAEGGTYSNLTDAIKAAESYNKDNEYGLNHVFTYAANGMQVTVEELPGEPSQYYTYLETLEGAETDDAQYLVAYYYTTVDIATEGWSAVNEGNTARVTSHAATESATSKFTVQWGATIMVPNVENRLFVQKRDENNAAVNGAVFALYQVGEDEVSTTDGTTYPMYYIADDNTHVYLGELGENNQGKAALSYDGLSSDSAGTYSIAADGVITVIINSTTHTITPADTATTAEAGDEENTADQDGTGVFKTVPAGYYVVREVDVPAGYALNTAETKVLVNEDAVYANAGTSDNGVMVGNGVGYLVSTLDTFATEGSIDETLTWIYSILRVNTGYDSFSELSLSNEQQYVKRADDNGIAGMGTDTTTDRSEAMVTYLVYDPSSERDYFDYRAALTQDVRTPGSTITYKDLEGNSSSVTLAGNDDHTHIVTLAGEGTQRLYSDEGWTALEVYQDYFLGAARSAGYTEYTDLEDQNISNLFSNSTFILYTDKYSVGDLEISKTVLPADDTQEFTFNLTLSAGEKMITTLAKSYYYTIYDVDEDGTRTIATSSNITIEDDNDNVIATYSGTITIETTTDENGNITSQTGEATITLKNKQIVVIEGLPYGTAYTVTETLPKSNTALPYTTLISVNEGGSVEDTETGDTLLWTEALNENNVWTVDYTNALVPLVQLVKVDGISNDTITLAGAKFVMYRVVTGTDDTTVTQYYSRVDGKWHELSVGKTESDYAMTTGDSGELLVANMNKAGTYYLKELAAPDGYDLLTEIIEFEVAEVDGKLKITSPTTDDKSSIYTVTDLDGNDPGQQLKMTVKNNPGYELPATGEAGTTLFTLGGLVMITGALRYGCGLRRRRERRAK